MNDAPDILLMAAETNMSRYRTIITDALKALDDGRYGDLRRILVRGTDKGLMTQTGVIAKDAP